MCHSCYTWRSWKKGLIGTAARSVLAEELDCVLHEYNERLKRNCHLAHGDRTMNSSHKFKGEKHKYFGVAKTEEYWKRLSRQMLTSLSLKG